MSDTAHHENDDAMTIADTHNPTQPLRVLYIARAPFVSGAERALMSMLRHLDRDRIEPHLVLGNETELADIAQSIDVPVTVMAVPKRSKWSLFGWWRSLRQLSELVCRWQPQVMHANDVPSCQAMSVVGGKLGVPRVVHVRWVISAASAGWWARGGAECLLCISRWIRQQLGDPAGTPIEHSRFEILPDAVDWPAEQPSESSVAVADSHAAGSRNGPTLGFSGQLIESKGLDLVIRALGELSAADRPRLLVAGEDTQTGGVYKAKLQALAEQSGVASRIEWLGFLDDVSQLHRRVDAMVCPSRIEPLGLVPLEAARFAVPCLANRLGGLAETIEHGVTGWLVEPTVDAWADAIRHAHDRDALRRWGQAAHQRTRQHYSPMVYQQRLLDIYQTLTASPTQQPVGA